MSEQKPSPEAVDDDNPEWTADEVSRAQRFVALPQSLQDKLGRRVRGPQKAPLKEPTTIRFDSDVLEAFKATGRGWQTRMNDALRDWLRTHRP
ncbi:BrnA antitoxin family protein [Azohydromonas aeria]|uniref:BrnA antitoxin family protein n=1 Tax=Azohydromonas aeria TaxID=2590212 RepID=UPI0012FA684F|nr:BrnA antitoxin family protein [Azohydromonas aeria]